MTLARALTIAGLITTVISGCTPTSPGLAVDGRRLTLGVDSLTVYVIRGNDTTATGLIVDALATREVGGRQLLHRVYQTQDQVLGSGLDSLTDDLVTLAPVRHRSRGRDGSQFLEFGGGRVTGTTYLPNGDSTRVDTPLTGIVFNSSSFDMVLRSAPLGEDWTATVAAYLPGSGSVEGLKARVVGSAMVHGERCWQVDADFAGMPVTFWITQDGRKMRQQVMHVRPDISILFLARSVAGRIQG